LPLLLLCCHLTYLAENMEDISDHAATYSFKNDIDMIATFSPPVSFNLAT